MRSRWTRSLSLRWRLFVLIMTLAGLLFVDAVLGATYNSRLEQEQLVTAGLRPVEEIPERLIAGLVDQQNSVRGFALTGDERLLNTYEQRQRAEGRAIINLREDLRGQPHLVALVDGVAVGAQAWHMDVAEPVISLTRAGQTARAAQIVATKDVRLFGALRADALALSRAIDVQLAASQERAVAAGERLDQRLLVTSLLGLFVVLLAGWLVRTWLTRPVIRLSEQVRRVAAGRLDEPIESSGPLEFQSLGDDVEVMRRRIIDELRDTHRAVEALQQNAPLVMSLRSELMNPELDLPPGLRMAARFEPAEGVLAGDWMEFIRLEDDRIGVAVVDVSGHGPEAGLRALWLKHMLVPALKLELEPADALHWVAGQIGDSGEWFATCMVFEIDPATGRCLYANAGHPPALLLGPGGLRELWPTGPIFCDLPGTRWQNEQVTLEQDEVLVVYTDGITEARNAEGEEFGDERLADCLTDAVGLDVDRVADRVMESVHAFAGQLADDATLILMTRPLVHSGVREAPQRRAGANR